MVGIGVNRQKTHVGGVINAHCVVAVVWHLRLQFFWSSCLSKANVHHEEKTCYAGWSKQHPVMAHRVLNLPKWQHKTDWENQTIHLLAGLFGSKDGWKDGDPAWVPRLWRLIASLQTESEGVKLQWQVDCQSQLCGSKQGSWPCPKW